MPGVLLEYGPNLESSRSVRQMTLPLGHGGLGLLMQSCVVSELEAAIVAGAGQAERIQKGRPAVRCPLQGAGGAFVLARASTNGARSRAHATQQRRTCQRSCL